MNMERASYVPEMQIQAAAMLLAYKKGHPEASVDVHNPKNNPKDIQNAAYEEWNATGLRENFRTFIETNPGKASSMDLETLLTEVRAIH